MARFALLVSLVFSLGVVVRAEEEGAGENLAPAPRTFEAKVNQAIDRGVVWLTAYPKDDGSWGPCVGSPVAYDGTPRSPIAYETGPTSFSLFTLLKCGVPRKDACVKRGLRWLRKMEKSNHRFSSYESSSIILMLTAMYEAEEPMRTARSPTNKPMGSPFSVRDWKWLHKRVGHLIGPGSCRRVSGGWGYHPDGNREDNSATQFALLALRAAARAGYPVAKVCPTVWADALRFVRSLQTRSGNFRYTTDADWTDGITAAAVSSLLICRERLQVAGEEPPRWLEAHLEKGIAALGRDYAPAVQRQQGGGAAPYYHYCYLYAVERVGALSGKQLLGTKPWYRPGAEYLVGIQEVDGHWLDTTCMGPWDVLGTCFALLYLKKATPPAVITPSED